ncbi:MAG: hypothetical protein ACTHMV_04445 [Chitinophagaceae bacterium]
MKVWNTGVHTRPFGPLEEGVDSIREKKVFYGTLFAKELPSFFEDKSYGKSVVEIFYREFCLREGYNDTVLYYGPRKKIIDCAIVEEYSSVLEMNNEEYGRYLAKLYLERSQQFSELKIKDFDAKRYIEDLIEFFQINLLI